MDVRRETGGDERLRERLARAGPGQLTTRDLLAIVLGHGMPGRSASKIAADLLREVGGIHELSRARPSRLGRVAGVGEAQASRVIAAVELGRRTLCLAARAKLPLQNPSDLARFLLPRFGSHPVERFGVVMLDSRHRLMSVDVTSIGGLDFTTAIPRDVFREATATGAAAVVFFHNHPSGDVTPTREDLALTGRRVSAGEVPGIEVVDHLVLADTRCTSLRTNQTFRMPVVPP